MSLDGYVAPVFLTDRAKELNDTFYLLLNNLVKNYPEYKLHPTVLSSEDRTKTNVVVYQTYMTAMTKLQNDYFLYKNEILRNSEEKLKEVNLIDDKINSLDKENSDLTKQLAEMSNSSYSAEGMLDDTQITRNQILYGNVILFIIMATGGYMYYKNVINKQ